MERGPLTERAWWAVRRALEEAGRQGRPVSSSHLLLGVVSEGENLGRLALDDLGIDAGALERSLRRLWQEGPREPPGDAGPLPRRWWLPAGEPGLVLRLLGFASRRAPGPGPAFTSEGRASLEAAARASEEALCLFLSTEHLLLGLAEEESGRAARVLEHFGAAPARIREALARRLGAS